MHIYMAHYLGFTSTAALAAWEETMREHLNWYAREVLAEGRTERPDARAMVDYIDLETAAFERLGMSLAEGGPVHADTTGCECPRLFPAPFPACLPYMFDADL
jgi:hypothetical protein